MIVKNGRDISTRYNQIEQLLKSITLNAVRTRLKAMPVEQAPADVRYHIPTFDSHFDMREAGPGVTHVIDRFTRETLLIVETNLQNCTKL
jgi:hypothetical protein